MGSALLCEEPGQRTWPSKGETVASEPTQQNESPSDPPNPEGLLYHYTTQHGLLGILKQKCIWATHIRYLNDTSEGNIVSRVILEEFSSRYNTAPLFQMLGMGGDRQSTRCG